MFEDKENGWRLSNSENKEIKKKAEIEEYETNLYLQSVDNEPYF